MKIARESLAASTSLFVMAVLFGTLSLLIACGGSSSGSSSTTSTSSGSSTSTSNPTNTTPAGAASNVATVTVDSNLYVNGPYVTVKVCKPGSTTCSTIPYVLLDTGSYGLRVLNTPSGATSLSSLGLTPIASGSGNLAECAGFGDGSFVWGPVEKADVYISGETTTTHGAGGIPVHVIGDPSVSGDSSLPAIPSACGTTTDSGYSDTFSSLGANGILGIGPFIQDCPDCQTSTLVQGMAYYSCSGSNCTGVTVTVANQVSNPVAYFADNNGTIVELPNISSSGQASTTGSLVFGIGTQSNNGLSASGQSATVLMTDDVGNFTTQFKGTSYPGSFIDSGSNGLFFLDSSTIAGLVGGNPLPTCTETGDFVGVDGITSFYCGTLSSSATNVGTNGNSTPTSFSVANAETLFSANGGNNFALNNLAGPYTDYFDWGLPFFYGRYVYTAIQGVTPPTGVSAGPFVAY